MDQEEVGQEGETKYQGKMGERMRKNSTSNCRGKQRRNNRVRPNISEKDPSKLKNGVICV